MPRDARSQVFAPGLLHGKVALVTGGGTGLGRATAAELVRCGAAVTIAGRRAEVLQQAVEEIGASSEKVDWVAGDVRERATLRGSCGPCSSGMGRLDLLVNNAGGQYFTPAELIAVKGWRAVWRLNVEGTLNMAEAAFALAMGPAGGGTQAGARGSAGGGTIVNVTLSPHHGMPGMAHSGAARATVEALTRELALRWSDAGVTVAAVAPGPFDTEVMDKYPQTVRAGMARIVPLQRMGSVAEHAWLVALLASPIGHAFNGSTVTVDGARDNWAGPWPPPGLTGETGEVPTEERRGGRTGVRDGYEGREWR